MAIPDLEGITDAKILANPLKKRINFNVTNAAGDKVAILSDFIKTVTSSNTAAVKVVQDPNSKKWYAIGFKTGTATLTTTYINNKGQTKTATQTVTVTADAPTVASMTADKKVTVSNTASGASYGAVADYAATANIPNGVQYSRGLTNLVMTDSYGLSLDSNDINTVNFVYGLTFTVQHVSAKAGTAGDVTIDSNNIVHLAAGFKGTFDVVVTAPSGKTTTTEVTVN